MGNASGVLFGGWWTDARNNCDSTTTTTTDTSAIQDRGSPGPGDDKRASSGLSEEHKERLSEFKLELARKHEKRRHILEEKRKEMEELREEVVRLKRENEELKQTRLGVVPEGVGAKDGDSLEMDRLRKENEELRDILKDKSALLVASEDIIAKNRELRVSVAEMQRDLQNLNRQVVEFDKERQDYNTHVVALKDVIAVSKHMLQIRESQLKELKQKVDSIEESLASRETNMMSQDLRNEYERQLQNIRNLRTLYEERQRVQKREKEALVSQLDDVKKELAAEQTKVSELEGRIQSVEEDNSKKYDEIKTLESNLGLAKAESRQYQAELTVINQLFSEILLGFNSSQDIDLDRLQKHLEDHRDLLQNIVINEISPEVSSALPKVLLELLNEVNEEQEPPKQEEDVHDGKLETIKEESESQTSSVHQMNSAEEIVENLPKVWKVLIELLSHQKAPTNSLTDDEEDDNPCYKTVQTPKGPSVVLSVSQTFIRLKNLILEKKSLEKETSHLKQLNGHLENRLQDQEKRLELVQSELSKTWLVVGKMQKQHQMLHTQEKILRYELAQKRKLLTELKEQLEYSREKWTQAREKNSNTEQQWRQLRTEFASRRNTVTNDNSVESGYSDDRESSSSDEEPGYETDISEGAQKALGSEDVGCLPEIKEVASGATILDFTEDEIVDTILESSNTDDVHSEQKTDSVLNQDSVEKTEEHSVLHEVRSEVAGTSHGGGESEKCLTVPELSEKTDEKHREVSNLSAEEDRLQQISDQTEKHSTVAEDELESKKAPANVSDSTTEVNTQEDRLRQSVEKTEYVVVNSKEDSTPQLVLEEVAGPSCEGKKPIRSLEEVLAQRDERLRRLEGQAEQLVTKATNTANKSVVISNRLDDLHEVYGQDSSEVDLGGEQVNADSSGSDNEVPSTDVGVDARPTEDNQE